MYVYNLTKYNAAFFERLEVDIIIKKRDSELLSL